MTEFLMRHFAPAELYRDLHFVAVLQEPSNMLDLGLDIMFVRLRPEPDLFQVDNGLILFCFMIALGKIIFVFAVVHDLANRRSGRRRYFYKIKPVLFGPLLRVAGLKKAELCAVGPDQSNFGNPDPEVNS